MKKHTCATCHLYTNRLCAFLRTQESWDRRHTDCNLLNPLPLRPLDDDSRIEKEKDQIMSNIHEILKEAKEQQYCYEDFHHMAFAADTPEQQARHFQDVLVSAAAVADFRKLDITRCRFFVNSNGEARAEPGNT